MGKSGRCRSMVATISQELTRLDFIKRVTNVFLQNDSCRHCAISNYPCACGVNKNISPISSKSKLLISHSTLDFGLIETESGLENDFSPSEPKNNRPSISFKTNGSP